ncbi:MAG: hypothetical protein Q7U53_18030 [Anaerolineaceae bacterium]|nr:hypothetical protein [Anaerolineaceae bacterium]
MKKKLTQAHQQKPWRIQIQRLGFILLVLVVAVLSFFMNLNFTSKAAQAGVQIRILEAERESLIRSISANRTDLAMLTSATVMQNRAKELGFVPATRADIEYLYIEDYVGKQPQPVSLPPTVRNQETNYLTPAFTQSIWDWLYQGTFIMLDQEGK